MYLQVLQSKFKEVFFSVLPITLIVILLHLTISPVPAAVLWRFLIGEMFVVIGLTLFLIGVDLAIHPLGDLTGTFLAKTNKLWTVLLGGIVVGFFICAAEPDLIVLANQIEQVTQKMMASTTLLMSVSLGLAVMLAIGFLRIFYNFPLYKLLLGIYGLILLLSIPTNPAFLAMAFDASGSTTGVLAVPFILALSVGISKLKKDSKASEKDSFGLVAIASSGAIIAVLLLHLLSPKNALATPVFELASDNQAIWSHFAHLLFHSIKEGTISVLPLFLIFVVLQLLSFKLKKREAYRMFIGFGYVHIGLIIFLLATVITASTLIAYLTGPVTVMTLRKKRPDLDRPFNPGYMKWLAPVTFILTSLAIYWSMWPTTIQVIIVIALGLPIYFYYEIHYQHSNLKEQLHSSWWMIGYLIFMSLMSFVGSSGFGGQNWIKYPFDFVVIIIISLAFYYWGIKTGLKKIDPYAEKIAQNKE